MLGKFAVFFLLVVGAQGVFADPPSSPKTLWRNTNYFGHYVLFDRNTNSYVETVDCKALWRFKRVSSNLNEVYLRDEGRKLTVKISYDGMYLKFDRDSAYKFYQKGTFDKRVRFFHQQGGQWTGTVSRKDACQWEEQFPGASGPAFRFKAYAEDAASVYLYDASRNMRVKLNAADMWLQGNGATAFSFFKPGYWSEN